MEKIFKRTFSETKSDEKIEITGIEKRKLTSEELSALFSIINYRYEHMLETITYTDLKPKELISAISENAASEMLASAIVGRIWEMGVRRIGRTLEAC